jgi:hypothetical protein
MSVKLLGEYDVPCHQRGNDLNEVTGIGHLKDLVGAQYESFYSDTSNKRRGIIKQGIVDIIKEHGGRFLKRAGMKWEEVENQAALDKVKNCFSIAHRKGVSGFHVVPAVPAVPALLAVPAVVPAASISPAIPVGTASETDNETTGQCMHDLGVTNNKRVTVNNKRGVTVTKTTLSPSCTGEDVEHSTRDWRAYSVVHHLIMDLRWTFFLLLVVIQVVIIGDQIWIKIFFWLLKKKPYIKSRAISANNGGRLLGGILWEIVQRLHEAGYSLNNIHIYFSGLIEAVSLANSNHQDGHGHKHGDKALFRLKGGLRFSGAKIGGETIHSFDCEETPRVTLGDRNALCGEGKDGMNSRVHHSGVLSPDSISLVFQIVKEDRGSMTKEDCLVIMQIIEKVVTKAWGSGGTLLTHGLLAILGRFLSPPQAGMEEVEAEEVRNVVDNWSTLVGTHGSQEPSKAQMETAKALLPQLEVKLKERLDKLKQYGGPGAATAIDKELEEMFREPVSVVGTYYAFTQEIFGAGYNPDKDVLFMQGGSVKYRKTLRNTPGRKQLQSVGEKYWSEVERTRNNVRERSIVRNRIFREFHQESGGGWFYVRGYDKLTRLSYASVNDNNKNWVSIMQVLKPAGAKLPTQALAINIPPVEVLPPREELARTKNTELRSLCKDRNLSGSGKKSELVDRLLSYDPKAPPSKKRKGGKQVQQSNVDNDDGGVPNLDNCAQRDNHTFLDLRPTTKKLKLPPPAARKVPPTKLPPAARKVPPTQGKSKAPSNIDLGRQKKKSHPMLIKSRCV